MVRPTHACVLLLVLLPWWVTPGWAQVPGSPVTAGADGLISLTAEERTWIAAHPVIRVGHDSNYAPYSFLSPEGDLVGIDVRLFELISRRTGLRFQPEIRPVWAQVMEAFQAGQIDMLTGLAPIPERQNSMNFTRPYTYASDVVVVRDGTDFILQPADLAQRRVGLPEDYRGMRWALQQAVPTVTVVDFKSMDDVMRALAAGEIDATVCDLAHGAFLIKSLHLSNLRIGSVFGTSVGTSLTVRKDWPELVGIINKVFDQMTAADRRAVIGNWIVPLGQTAWWRSRAFRNVAIFAALAGLVALLMVFYSRRLAAELTARRRIQLQLEEALAQLARVSEEKSELMRMVAHDLRSPLTGFGMGAELLQSESGQLSGPAREILAKMINATGLMRRMVDDLVDVQMLEEGQRDYQSAEVDLGGLLRDATAGFAETAVRKGIRLTLREPEPGACLSTDAKALRRVVDNLLSNALKYSPPGSEVVITIRRTGGVWRLSVCDQGPGVKPDEQEKIFSKYGRGSARPTGGEESTGLGLWIVRRIVTALHGRVWCEAGPGAVGTVFVVELPLTPPADA